ncbi:MAG TPA: hypothetical protein VFU47_10420, partial [Armatimonadota bacterium]|nr:hypothetical protein [Armatimonadota bacterium]
MERWLWIVLVVGLSTFFWMTGGPLAWYFARRAGKLDRACRYKEAIPLYEQALRMTLPLFRFARAATLLRLGLA